MTNNNIQDRRLLFFRTKQAFLAALPNIDRESIVFIKDVPAIWTHGAYFDSGIKGEVSYRHATDQEKISNSKTRKLYKIGVTDEGHIASADDVVKADIVALGIPAQDTTYNNATTTTAGLMSAQDKQNLDDVVFAMTWEE